LAEPDGVAARLFLLGEGLIVVSQVGGPDKALYAVARQDART